MTFRLRPDEIMTLEDGFKYFWPEGYTHGCFSPANLRDIADELDKMNASWQEEMNNYFDNIG